MHYRRRLTSLLLVTTLAASLIGPATPGFAAEATATVSTRASLAKTILASQRISLATFHSSGVRDNATAHQNIVDTANGGRAHRSCYGSASNPHVRAFMSRCRALGAIEVLGPGDAGHATHIHCAWA